MQSKKLTLNFHSDKDKIFFTSDTHFGHLNIIKYCGRPFEGIVDHDETLIERWNEKIAPDDIVFHLGDFGFGATWYLENILKALNGKKYLIIGNHDWRNLNTTLIQKYFVTATQQMVIKIDGTVIYLNHFPFLCFSGAWKGLDASWQLFGHVHSGPNSNVGLDHERLKYLMPTQFDVGVDHNNFYPYSFEEIKEIITEQQMSLNMYRG